MQRATSFKPAGFITDAPDGFVVLPHDGRHLRRKLLHLDNGDMVMLDLGANTDCDARNLVQFA